MDEHNEYSEYINQLPDTESPTHDTSDDNNNIDRYADRVGAAVADRLGPLLGAAAQGIADRLDVLNKIAARLLLAQQPTGTAGRSGVGVQPTHGSTASVTGGAGATGNARGTNRQNGNGAPTVPRAAPRLLPVISQVDLRVVELPVVPA